MDRAALDDLFSATYEELRRLATSVRAGDSSETLSPTALVNEAYLKLVASPRFSAASPLHFRRIAARAMRQVLVEAARGRSARKRGGSDALVTFDDAAGGAASSPEEVILLDLALVALQRMHPRQADMVELRFFGGLGTRETADLLGVSEPTIRRDWRAARAWLARQMTAEA
jgi:RNA polymerase sigma factor (TIGR02999 family)